MRKTEFGPLNEHAVAIILKELIRRAMMEIRKKRSNFIVHEKTLSSGKKDIFTDADIEAERVILRSLKECFPDFDIISEEDKKESILNLKITDGLLLTLCAEPETFPINLQAESPRQSAWW